MKDIPPLMLKAVNTFHGTETWILVWETYETKDGGHVAVCDRESLDDGVRELCGMTDCQCGGLHLLTDDDDVYYAIDVK